MSDELKPCPFCGSECVNDTDIAPYDHDDDSPVFFWVCPDCTSCGPIETSEEIATKSWNTRHVSASKISNNTKETHLRVKELEEALSETLRIISMYVGRKNNPVYDDALKVLKNK